MMETRRRAWPDVAFRALFSGIFVVAGAQHLLRPAAVLEHLERAPLGRALATLVPAEPLIVAAGLILLVGGLALLLGIETRRAALVLIALVLPITILVQLRADTLGPLFKNVAILGGLVHFAFAAKARAAEPILAPIAAGARAPLQEDRS